VRMIVGGSVIMRLRSLRSQVKLAGRQTRLALDAFIFETPPRNERKRNSREADKMRPLS